MATFLFRPSTIINQQDLWAWLHSRRMQQECAHDHRFNADSRVGWFPYWFSSKRSRARRNFRLRHEVFYHELQGLSADRGIDVDDFDHDSDHLILREASTQTVIGTYRLRCSRFTERFYSHTEFTIDGLLTDPRTKVEVGRACLHHGWRNNLALIALWRGLTSYLRSVEAQVVFGCSSVLTTDATVAAVLTQQFADDQQLLPADLQPRDDHRHPDFSLALANPLSKRERKKVVEAWLPPLLRCYLRAGARVSQAPVLDRDFQCLDWLTVLDLNQCNDSFVTRYGG